MSFELRFPFRPQSPLTGIGDSAWFEVGNLSARVRDRAPYVILDIRGFASEQAARDFLPHVGMALRWVLIEGGLNSTYDLDPQELAWAENPDMAARNLSTTFATPIDGPVHGLGSEGAPAIYEEGRQLRFLAMGEARVAVTTPIGLFLNPLVEALGRPGIASLYGDSRFRLAADLYSAFFFENSRAARLVSLGMALEVLAEPLDKHLEALQLLDRWLVELRLQKLKAADDDAIHGLESLERELLIRREASIRSRIRRTALNLAKHLDGEKAKQLARDAVATYDARSTLVHEGSLSEPGLTEAVEKGQASVRALLRLRFDLETVRPG